MKVDALSGQLKKPRLDFSEPQESLGDEVGDSTSDRSCKPRDWTTARLVLLPTGGELSYVVSFSLTNAL